MRDAWQQKQQQQQKQEQPLQQRQFDYFAHQ